MYYSDDPYGPVVPARSGPAYTTRTATNYTGGQQLVPVARQQPTSLPVAGQLVTYGNQQQQFASADLVAYDRYVSSPPTDVMYTKSSNSSSRDHHMTDGWNGMWRQSSQPYVLSTQPTPIQQKPVYLQQPTQQYIVPERAQLYYPGNPKAITSSTPYQQQGGIQYSVGSPASQFRGYY